MMADHRLGVVLEPDALREHEWTVDAERRPARTLTDDARRSHEVEPRHLAVRRA